MEYFTLISLALVLLVSLIISISLYNRRPPSSNRRRPLPPGPHPFPIIGNMLQLGSYPHLSLAKLSKTYGPIMHLKLGGVDTIVVSSPQIAKQILQKHDQSFPGRKPIAATRALDHHKSSVACLPVGAKWRNLRKICREQMFSSQRLDASKDLRREKLLKLREYIQECCGDDERVVDVGEAAFVTSLNLISNTLFSIDFAGYEAGSLELKGVVHGLMGVLGSFNVADYFSVVGGFDFDPQGIKREAEFYFGKLLAIFDGIIDKRMLEFGEKGYVKKNDLLEALLETSRGDEAELSRNDIKHLLLDLFVAGTDTTSGTVEWVMTELLRNPDVMSKAKNELITIIGQDKQLEESDISKLPYLQSVIKETFRYHPPGPFLARQKDENELEINNFVIPNNALILINIWALGRDPTAWSDPDSFKPERFLNVETDVKGHDFELVPFGGGRRICPALPLAYRMVHLMVASLIHNFDWKLENGMTTEEVDISEKFGLSLQKAVPLKAVPIKI